MEYFIVDKIKNVEVILDGKEIYKWKKMFIWIYLIDENFLVIWCLEFCWEVICRYYVW